MQKERYMKTQLEIIKIAKQIYDLPLETFLEAAIHAETVAPMIDPTMYRKAADNLRAIKILAHTMLPIKAAYGQTVDAVLKTAMRGDMYTGPKPVESDDGPPPKGA